jgi:pyridoxamine 5'-phosphate oxidase
LPDEESDAYFAGRPRGAQLSAWASAQSDVVPLRAELEARVAELEAEYAGRDVPRPPHWGGTLVVPDAVEFWQGREDRLHDRLVYRRADVTAGWAITRLQP